MAVVFVATLAARLGAPVPAVPFLIVAGALSVGGRCRSPARCWRGLAGNLIGDAAWFLAGRRWGYGVMRLLCRISLSADSCVQRSESFLGRWGGVSLIAAKFVPGVSVVAPPMAGALKHVERTLPAVRDRGRADLDARRSCWSGVCSTRRLPMCWRSWRRSVSPRPPRWCWRWRRCWRGATGNAGAPGKRRRSSASRSTRCAGRWPPARPRPLLIDVRADAARALDARAIPGAIAVALANLVPGAVAALAQGRELVLFCDCPDDASALAGARLLHAAGLPQVRVLAGGLDAWMAAHAVEPDVAAAERAPQDAPAADDAAPGLVPEGSLPAT